MGESANPPENTLQEFILVVILIDLLGCTLALSHHQITVLLCISSVIWVR